MCDFHISNYFTQRRCAKPSVGVYEFRGGELERGERGMALCVTHVNELETDLRRAVLIQIEELEPPRNGRKSYVYWLHNPHTDLIKIGRSTHPEKRIQALSTAAGVALKVLLVLPESHLVNERFLHVAFDDLRVLGEWFEPHQALLDHIEVLRAANGFIKQLTADNQ